MTRHAESDTSPVSFRVHVLRLPKRGMPVRIEATDSQSEALAGLHGLLSVERFQVDLLVSPWKRNGIQVEGTVEAAIVQQCVVTLEPLPSRIAEAVSALYLPEDSKLGREGFGQGGEIVLEADGPDSPETFSGDSIDVGALAEEFFGLAIDPYPRKAEAKLDKVVPGEEQELAESELHKKLKSLLNKS